MSIDSIALSLPQDDRNTSGTLLGIPVVIDVIVGSAQMSISKLLELEEGATIVLDRKLLDPVAIAVNGRIIAKGIIVALDNDPDQLAVSLSEIV